MFYEIFQYRYLICISLFIYYTYTIKKHIPAEKPITSGQILISLLYISKVQGLKYRNRKPELYLAGCKIHNLSKKETLLLHTIYKLQWQNHFLIEK